jgi:hypothetical protein
MGIFPPREDSRHGARRKDYRAAMSAIETRKMTSMNPVEIFRDQAGFFATGQWLRGALDRRTDEPGDLRDNREAPSTRGSHFGRRKQAPSPLVKPGADRTPAQANRGFVDHVTDVRLFAENRNPQNLSQSTHNHRIAIQLLF